MWPVICPGQEDAPNKHSYRQLSSSIFTNFCWIAGVCIIGRAMEILVYELTLCPPTQRTLNLFPQAINYH